MAPARHDLAGGGLRPKPFDGSREQFYGPKLPRPDPL
jgi:hypothetical protein